MPKVTRPEWNPAYGWLTIAAVVVGWDLGTRRSLTSFARQHRSATYVIGAYVLGHLTGHLP